MLPFYTLTYDPLVRSFGGSHKTSKVLLLCFGILLALIIFLVEITLHISYVPRPDFPKVQGQVISAYRNASQPDSCSSGRVAILLSGGLRGMQLDNFERMIVAENEKANLCVHVFAHVWSESRRKRKLFRYHMSLIKALRTASYLSGLVVEPFNPTKWRQVQGDMLKLYGGKTPLQALLHSSWTSGTTNVEAFMGVLSKWRKYQLATKMFTEYEAKTGAPFDIVLRLRPDTFFHAPFQLAQYVDTVRGWVSRHSVEHPPTVWFVGAGINYRWCSEEDEGDNNDLSEQFARLSGACVSRALPERCTKDQNFRVEVGDEAEGLSQCRGESNDDVIVATSQALKAHADLYSGFKDLVADLPRESEPLSQRSAWHKMACWKSIHVRCVTDVEYGLVGAAHGQ